MAYTPDQIGGMYKQYLGRDLQNPEEAQGWLDNPDAEKMISGSGEAQAFKKAGAAGTPWSGTPTSGAPGAGSSGSAGQYVSGQMQSGPAGPGQTAGQGPGYGPPAGTPPVTPPGTPPGTPPVPGNNGWYTEGDKTYDAKGTLQGAGTYNRAALKDAITRGGSNFNAGQFIAAHQGDFAKGVTMVSPDKIKLPDGEILDVSGNVNAQGEGGAWWGSEKDWQEDEAAGKHVGGAGGGGGGGGGGIAGKPDGGGAGGGGYGTSGQRDELYNMLMARAKQGLDPGAMSANIRAQADPYAASVERERRRFMGDTAERMGPLANIQGEERLSSEKAGQASGLFESQLIGREMQSRRDEIAQALGSMQGMLSQEQQLAMQRELAQLDASIRNRQIGSQNDQFLAGLGLQSENQGNYWDAIRSGLIGG